MFDDGPLQETDASQRDVLFGTVWGEPLRQCIACAIESEVGAHDPDSGVWYCKQCWESWEEHFGDWGNGPGQKGDIAAHPKEIEKIATYDHGERVCMAAPPS